MKQQIEASGRIRFGPGDSPPWIEISPTASGRVRLKEAETFVSDPSTQWRTEKKRTSRGIVAGIRGVNQEYQLSIRFLRSARQSDVNAMRRIAAADSVPPTVAGAVLAACVGLRKRKAMFGTGPSLVASLCSLKPTTDSETEHDNSEIENLADRVATYLVESLIEGTEALDELHAQSPAGSVDRAHLWLAVGRRLWRPDMLRRIGHRLSLKAISASGLGLTLTWAMQAHVFLLPLGTSTSLGNGVEVRTPNVRKGRGACVRQALELAAGDISSEALLWLSRGTLPLGWTTIGVRYDDDEETPPTPDRDMATALSRQFLREAKREAVYAPTGAFIVDVPDDLHLSAWGVRRLKIWCEPDCLWCGVVDDDEELSCIFQWSPGSPLRSWLPHELIKPALQATLAALWRDLRIAGEDVFPAYGSARSKWRQRQSTSRRTRKRLPTKKRYMLEDRRTWGSKEEHDAIRRRAHGVRGHLRQLPEGWQRSEDAVELARAHSLSLPDGFTFVRPHVRGGKNGDEAEVPEATIVQAQGLSSLVTLLGLGE